MLSTARDARRISNDCYLYPAPGRIDLQKHTSIHKPLSPAEAQVPHPPHRSLCNHGGHHPAFAFGVTRTMNRRSRCNTLRNSNRYFHRELRQFMFRFYWW